MRNKDIPYGGYNSTALVTGAAGGMGKIYAEMLACNGYNLVLVDLSADRLEDTVRDVRGKVAQQCGTVPDAFTVMPLSQDLSEMDAAEKIAARVHEAGMAVDILINNAGLLFVREIAAAERKKLSAIMMVHNYTPLSLHSILREREKAVMKRFVLAYMPMAGHGIHAARDDMFST